MYSITPEELIKHDKKLSQLEDEVRVLKEALEEAEAEIIYKDAQLNLALELCKKAHEFREYIQYDQKQLALPLNQE